MEDIININEYVRTNDGSIYQLEDLEDQIFLSDKFYNNIVKHSKNIIDIIEEGDFVNGYICKRIPNFDNKMCNFDLNLMQWIPLEDIDIWYDVVTHEQFKQMKYIVGEQE